MQSPDWPDLPFVRPTAFGTGRDGQRAMYSVVHYTAGSERSTSAEDGASYDSRRTDGTSTHYFHDSDSTVQCVRLADRANACFAHGNRQGIQHELCGTQQTRAQWLDPASRATIRRTAFQIVRDHTRLGIPFRRLTPAQVRACWSSGDPSKGGICGHADVTLAWPEDHGSHMDPGTEFPWDVLLADIEDIRNGGDDMTEEQWQTLQRVALTLGWLVQGAKKTGPQPGLSPSQLFDIKPNVWLEQIAAAAAADETRDNATLAAVRALTVATGNDPKPILDAIAAAAADTHALVTQLQQQLAAVQTRALKQAQALAAAGVAFEQADD